MVFRKKGDTDVGRTRYAENPRVHRAVQLAEGLVVEKRNKPKKARTKLTIKEVELKWTEPVYLEMLRYYASDGLSKKVIAEKLNISLKTLERLLAKHEEVRAAFQWGIDHMISRVESALLRSALGLTIVEKRHTIVYDTNNEIKETKDEVIEKEIPPNVDAIRCFLFARAKDRYNKADNEVKDDRTINITIKKTDGSIQVHDVIPITPQPQRTLLNYDDNV